MSPRRVAALLGLLFAIVVGIAGVRQLSAGAQAVALADAAAAKSDWPMAIAQSRTAAEALTPGSPWTERGWQRLEAIGHDAEARGDDQTALLAYGAMRAASLATRGPLSGWQRRRAQADEGLARVAASTRDPAARPATATAMLDALHASEPPALGLLLALAAASLALVGALARLSWLGAGPSGAAGERVTQAVAAVALVVYAALALTR